MHLAEAVRVVVEVIASDDPCPEQALQDRIDAALAGEGLMSTAIARIPRSGAGQCCASSWRTAPRVPEAPVALQPQFRRR